MSTLLSSPQTPETPNNATMDTLDSMDTSSLMDASLVVDVWCTRLENSLSVLNDFCCNLSSPPSPPSSSSLSAGSSPQISTSAAIDQVSVLISRSISLAEEYSSLQDKSSRDIGLGRDRGASVAQGNRKNLITSMEQQMDRTMRCAQRVIEECGFFRGNENENEKDKDKDKDKDSLLIYKLCFGSTASILYLGITYFNNPCNTSSPTMSHNADYLISYISTATRFLSSTPLTPPVSSLFFEILSEPYLAFFSNVLTMVSSTSSPSSTSFSAITAIESTVLLVENIKHISISSNSHHIIINPISSKLSDSPLSNCSPTILYPKPKYKSLAAVLAKLLDESIDSFNIQQNVDDTISDMLEVLVSSLLNAFRILTGISDKQIKAAMLKNKLPVILCKSLQGLPDTNNACSGMERSFATDANSALSSARAIGRLSLSEPMRQLINEDPHNVRDLFRLLVYWSDKFVMMQYTRQDDDASSSSSSHHNNNKNSNNDNPQILLNIILRCAFCLGNLTSSNDSNRKFVVLRFGGDNSMGGILSGLTASYMRENDDSPEKPLLADTLVKLTRLIANICINREAAIGLAVSTGIDSLGSLLMIVIENEKEEELLVNVVSCITNLSFYGRLADSGDDGEGFRCKNKIFDRREEICGCLVGVLLHDNKQAVVEASRAFGNFSRDDIVRGMMVHARADEAMAMLLDTDSDNLENGIVYSVIGCFVNIAADVKWNRIFVSQEAIIMEYRVVCRLIKLLRKSGLKEMTLSSVICKVFSNLAYSCGGASSHKFTSCFHDLSDLDLLGDTLEELLDIAKDAHDEAFEEEQRGGERTKKGGNTTTQYSMFIETGTPLEKTVREAQAFHNTTLDSSYEEESKKNHK